MFAQFRPDRWFTMDEFGVSRENNHFERGISTLMKSQQATAIDWMGKGSFGQGHY
jgi:hypothetical protein